MNIKPDEELTPSLLEELILKFDVIHSPPERAQNFIAWLQLELGNQKKNAEENYHR